MRDLRMRRIMSKNLAWILAMLISPCWLMAGGGAADASAAKAASAEAAPAAEPAMPSVTTVTTDPLIQLLATKGILTAGEAQNIMSAPAGQMRDRLVLLLKEKGILSEHDLNALSMGASTYAADAASNAAPIEEGLTTQATGPTVPPPSIKDGPVSAVIPVRVFPVGLPQEREGLIPAIHLGDNIRFRPYGIFQTGASYDTASPYGNDFPLPGFNPIVNGPDKLPEFHLQARALRLGTDFEWLDIAPNVILTGKFEMDFAGNFGRSNNSTFNSIHANTPLIRVAYGRIDWAATDKTSLLALFGQDWTPFGSSTLPDLLESNGLGFGFGTLYQRAPQMRFGFNHKFGSDRDFQIQPEFAVVDPAFAAQPADLTSLGNVIPGNEGVANQLGYGERQGADSQRPEVQARIVTQFQLDKAPNVPPAQIIFSGTEAERSVVVLANAVPTLTFGANPLVFKNAFPNGVRIHSHRDGFSGEAQLPTRWFTLIAKYYSGSDLRAYGAGQLFALFNKTTGLTSTATAQSIDGSATTVFGLLNGVPVIAPQLPPRSQGGFVNLGLPFSRWVGANSEGRNSGWTMYLHYGRDQALARDVRREGGGRQNSDVSSAQLQYKFNRFITFAFEQSLYRTRAIPLTATGLYPSFQGRPMRELNDVRSEFGTIFTF